MTYIYVFFTVFNFIVTAGSMYIAYRISRSMVAPTLTWTLFAAAFCIRLVSLTYSTLFTRDIIGFLSNYTPWTVVLSNVMSATVSILMLLALLRIRAGIKSLTTRK